MDGLALPVSLQALVAVIAIALVVPYITAFVTSYDGNPVVKSVISGGLTGLGAISAYLVDVNGVPDWKHALGLFVAAIAVTQGFRKGIDPGSLVGLPEERVQKELGRT